MYIETCNLCYYYYQERMNPAAPAIIYYYYLMSDSNTYIPNPSFSLSQYASLSIVFPLYFIHIMYCSEFPALLVTGLNTFTYKLRNTQL